MNITDKAFVELRKIFPQIPEKNVLALSISLQHNETPVIVVQQQIFDVEEIKQVNHVYFIDSTVGGKMSTEITKSCSTDEQDAKRYRWLRDNHTRFSWNPSRYNSSVISGFAAFNTGYSGYNFEDAIDLAMKENGGENESIS